MDGPRSSVTSVAAGSSTGEMAITRSIGRCRASACAATRSMKLPPSENPASTIGKPGKFLRQRAHRAHHFRQPAGVEQIAVQVMRGAVIAQVEAHHFESGVKQGLRQ